MKNVLFCWMGKADLSAAADNEKKGPGPIYRVLSKRKFHEVVLLSDFSEKESESYAGWLKQKKRAAVTLCMVSLGGNPTDYRAIYETTKLQIQGYLDKTAGDVELTFLVNSGTQQMSTIWVILASSWFDANLLQSTFESGVEDVDFPFEISADYLPNFLGKNEKRILALFSEHGEPAGFAGIVHRSQVMKSLLGRARLVAPYPTVPVLIQGDSGTGKELLARGIHELSLRKGAFVPINCGAIPEGIFESELFGSTKGGFSGAVTRPGFVEKANGGTLFLDEIGEMPPAIQVKLLRMLQEKTFCKVGDSEERKADARIIAATNRNLMDCVVSGAFREDLFHRLAVGTLWIPALNEREDDISLIIDAWLDHVNNELSSNGAYMPKKITGPAKAFLKKQEWPGNVRELQNTIMRAALWTQGDVLDKPALQEAMITRKDAGGSDLLNRPIENGVDLDALKDELYRHYIARAIELSGGNKKRASELVGFKDPQRIYRWLERYDL